MAKVKGSKFLEEREKTILQMVERNGRVTVDELADVLSTSASTVRIQLNALHEKGVLMRTHGGAVKMDYPREFSQRKHFKDIPNFAEKKSIAKAAAKTVRDGDVIAIGGGTTALLFATELHDEKELTVVTDSIFVANELVFDRKIAIKMCGGALRGRNAGCSGPIAEDFFKGIVVNKSYSGVDSISFDYGLTSLDTDPRSEMALLKCGRERYILADHTKFNVKPFMEKMGRIEDVTHIVTDSLLEKELVRELEKMGIEVITQ